MSEGDVTVRFNHIPKITAQMHQNAAKLVAETASEVESRVKPEWNSYDIQTRTKTKKGLNVEVSAGGIGRRWHAVFVEYGTAFQPARRIMTKAAEGIRSEFERKAGGII